MRLASALALAPTTARLLDGLRGLRLSGEQRAQRAEELKATIRRLSGRANGTDCSPEQRDGVAAALAELAPLSPSRRPAREDLRGSVWRLVYTDSSGNSSGKLGPLVGAVRQEFAADGRSYANVVALGLLEVRLEAEYEAETDSVLDVRFVSINLVLALGGASLVLATKPFADDPRPGGKWDMLYSDGATRALRITPGTGNVFVLDRVTTTS